MGIKSRKNLKNLRILSESKFGSINKVTSRSVRSWHSDCFSLSLSLSCKEYLFWLFLTLQISSARKKLVSVNYQKILLLFSLLINSPKTTPFLHKNILRFYTYPSNSFRNAVFNVRGHKRHFSPALSHLHYNKLYNIGGPIV